MPGSGMRSPASASRGRPVRWKPGRTADGSQRLAAELPDAVRRRLVAGLIAVKQNEVGAIAIARPMPRALPVTTTVRPVRSNRFVMDPRGSIGLKDHSGAGNTRPSNVIVLYVREDIIIYNI
jgi:hypothetical protein